MPFIPTLIIRNENLNKLDMEYEYLDVMVKAFPPIGLALALLASKL